MSDTRKDRRAPLSLKVRFKSATVDEFVEHYAKDISRGGLFIKSKDPMPVGTLLKFEFQLKDESRLIHGVGRVVWKRELSEAKGDELAPGMGIKFIKMDPESRSLVEHIVATRGDAPAAFETGGGERPERLDETPTHTPTPATLAASAKPAATADSGAAAPSSAGTAKAAEPFFPSTSTPAEMPLPEDRTQMRQMREFLAAALSEGGANEAAQAAEKEAEAARKRAGELEQARKEAEREAAEERKRAKEEADLASREEERAKADKAKSEIERAGKAREREKDEAEKRDKPTVVQARLLPETEETSSLRAARIAKELEAEQAEKRAEQALRGELTEPSSIKEAPQPKSNMMWVGIVALVLVGGGLVYMFTKNGGTAQPGSDGTATAAGTEPSPEPSSPSPEASPSEAASAAPSPSVEPSAQASAAAVDPTASPSAEPSPEASPSAEPSPQASAAATMVTVRIDTSPAGAEVLLDGQARGNAPVTVQLEAGSSHRVSADAVGFAATEREFVAQASGGPVRVALTALPYSLTVTTTPDGARVAAGAVAITSPGTLELGRVRGPVAVAATKPGFIIARQTVSLDSFSENGDHMTASVSLTLAPRPVAATPTPTPSASTEPGTTPSPATSPRRPRPTPSTEPGGEEPSPSPRPRPSPTAEPIPDNPFG